MVENQEKVMVRTESVCVSPLESALVERFALHCAFYIDPNEDVRQSASFHERLWK